MIEQAIDSVGLSMMNIKEFNKGNMRAFNEVAEDHGNVEYYSMGARRARSLCAEVLQYPHEVIAGQNAHVESDGLMMWKETQWGRYLITIDADHFEMGGLKYSYDAQAVFRIVAENLKLMEIRSDEESSRQYSFLFNE